jgi:hypothetical protein
MPTKAINELREILLRAGVAPRQVRRYLTELTDHLADLSAEEERAGRSRTDAESEALARLGSIDHLAKAMINQRQFQAWSVRAPWAMFGLGPLFLLAGAWFVALFILWSGWKIFMPGADTPLGVAARSMYSLANIYFQIDRAFYFGAPILIGWWIGLVGARQRLNALWPIVGLVLIALIGGTTRVNASRTAVHGGFGHISMNFALGTPDQRIFYGPFHAMAILSLTVLPYLIWRFQKALSLSA